ncbi:carboxypeptidase-like regulatory domain-containing protein [Leadbetterella byssophila]|uniref:carboxypeptidase-like regulatory domain-containing protein n=1 Tax=Leadbetterella byssophila TaxID=316068 RepID=UPI00399F361A
MKNWLVTFLGILLSGTLFAQKYVDRKVSLQAEREPLRTVLTELEKQGGFYFSYDSKLLKLDSIVSVRANQQTLRSVLHTLFQERFQFKESGEHLVILPTNYEKYINVTGQVLDDTGPVDFVSVYSKDLLLVTLTDESGLYRLKVKEKILPFTLTFSRLGYKDTSILVTNSHPENIRLQAKDYLLQEVRIQHNPIERSFLSRWFVSKKLRIHSRNITHFFVNTPYQLSLFPGVGTQGRMATKSINKVSLNTTGGYTSGTEGVELSGAFNITRGDVRYVQAAGLFNLVEGEMKGGQFSGAYNYVHGGIKGVQAAGIGNQSSGKGAQLSGLFNKANDLKGFQAAGFFNHSTDFAGLQMAGFMNIVSNSLEGVQVAGFYNQTKELRGVQIGMVNRAKRSSGYSIGLLNLIGNGNANFSLGTSEFLVWNASLKTGNKKLYTILTLGKEWKTEHIWPGVGLGRELTIGKQVTSLLEYVHYMSVKEEDPSYHRFQFMLTYPAHFPLQIMAGPSFTLEPDKHTWGAQAGLAWYFRKKKS